MKTNNKSNLFRSRLAAAVGTTLISTTAMAESTASDDAYDDFGVNAASDSLDNADGDGLTFGAQAEVWW